MKTYFSPSQFFVRDKMTEVEFDRMMESRLEEALKGISRSTSEVFADLRKGILETCRDHLE